MKILIIGPISSVGGINIHINRLAEILLNNKINIDLIDDSPTNLSTENNTNIRSILNLFRVIKKINRCNLAHIHSGHWLIRIFAIFLMLLCRKNFIVTLHSFRLNRFQSFFTRFFLNRASKIIIVNKEYKKNITGIDSSKIITLEAFLPPTLTNDSSFPISVTNKINSLSDNTTILCSNAYKLITFKQGELYGLDQCIELCKLAKTRQFPLHVFFVILVIL